MFRLAQVSVPASRLLFKRNLASTVLLSRSWHENTVVELRREAKSRGLSSTGTKAVLIQRLEEFESKKAREATPAPAPASTRNASTAASTATASPGNPPQPTAPYTLNIQIPDLSVPEPEPSVQIPYVPDFWASSTPAAPEPEPSPKMVVIAGATTHPGGGPSHNLIDEPVQESESASAPQQPATPSNRQGGLFYDIAEDLGFLSEVPASKPAKKPFWQLFS